MFSLAGERMTVIVQRHSFQKDCSKLIGSSRKDPGTVVTVLGLEGMT